MRFFDRRLLMAMTAALLMFPRLGVPMDQSLDRGWRWGLSALPEVGALHGRDVAFTYGPLAPVILPTALTRLQPLAATARVALYLLFAATLLRAARAAPAGPLAAGLLVLLLAGLWCLLGEHLLLLTLFLLIGPSLMDGRNRTAVNVGAAMLAAACVFIRFSLGLAAVAALVVFLLFSWRDQPAQRLRLLLPAAVFLTTLVGLGALFLRSWSGAASWIAAQIEIARGYPFAMSLRGLERDLYAGLASLALFALVLFAALLLRNRLALVCLVAAPALGLSFLVGYTRQDLHVVHFYSFLVSILGVTLILARKAESVRLASTLTTAILVVLIPIVLSTAYDADALTPLAASRPMSDLAIAAAPLEPLVRLDAESRQNLSPLKLPRPLVNAIRRCDLSVDSIPFTLALIPANGFRWAPNPLLQLYAAYTAALDGWEARHFAGNAAAQILLVRWESIDSRHPLWDTPRTWRAIMENYRWQADADPQTALLRRQRSASWSLDAIAQGVVHPGQWIDVPVARSPASSVALWVFAEIHLEANWRGHLGRYFLGVPEVLLETRSGPGDKPSAWRIVPGTASGGLLVSPSTKNLEQLTAALRGNAGANPQQLRLRGPGVGAFRQPTRITFLAGLPPQEPNDAPGGLALNCPDRR